MYVVYMCMLCMRVCICVCVKTIYIYGVVYVCYDMHEGYDLRLCVYVGR